MRLWGLVAGSQPWAHLHPESRERARLVVHRPGKFGGYPASEKPAGPGRSLRPYRVYGRRRGHSPKAGAPPTHAPNPAEIYSRWLPSRLWDGAREAVGRSDDLARSLHVVRVHVISIRPPPIPSNAESCSAVGRNPHSSPAERRSAYLNRAISLTYSARQAVSATREAGDVRTSRLMAEANRLPDKAGAALDAAGDHLGRVLPREERARLAVLASPEAEPDRSNARVTIAGPWRVDT